MKRLSPLAVVSFVVFFAAATPSVRAEPMGYASPVWQWSVPTPTIPGRRAFLWISPETTRVRGLVVACQNMIEKPLFERDDFRAACAENGLGLVLVFPGHDVLREPHESPDHPKRSALDIFLNPDYPNGAEHPKAAGEDLQKVLDALAAESGYGEIRFAPLCAVGHSSAGPFAWHLYRWDPTRFFAMLPFKAGARNDGPEGIPVFEINSEWYDFGKSTKRSWAADFPPGGVVKARNGGATLYGTYTDVGSGHCNVSDDSISMFRLFLKKAVAARIPVDAPLDAPVALKPIRPESGWLLDAATFGKPNAPPVACADWKQDPAGAYWYLDRELAAAVQDHMVAQLAKKPQMIGFVENGVPNSHGGTFNFGAKFLDDAGTFSVEAKYIDTLTETDLFSPGEKIGHSGDPILYRVNSGGVVQTGPHTFRVCPHAGPTASQGNPWEPTLVAYVKGSAEFRPTEKPAHVYVNIINQNGAPQTIDFPKIADQKYGALAPLTLSAHASSGLPVQFIPVSGPITIEGNALRFTRIPPRAKFPVRVLVSTFQFGRPGEPKIQSALSEPQEFWITK